MTMSIISIMRSIFSIIASNLASMVFPVVIVISDRTNL
jgi:hypothetical protein